MKFLMKLDKIAILLDDIITKKLNQGYCIPLLVESS